MTERSEVQPERQFEDVRRGGSGEVVQTAGQQRRVRRAVEHVLLCRNAPTAALNKWLDEPGALRR